MDVDDLYQELIVEHYKRPRCKGTLKRCDACVQLVNPLCGDEIALMLSVDRRQIAEIAFDGKGCCISQAAASLMAELCKGKSLDQARKLSELYKEMLKGKLDPELGSTLGDVQALQSVGNFPGRVRCALLPWEALERCLTTCEEKCASCAECKDN